MNDTIQLLRDYTENGSEPAFREIVSRYVDLVYSVAFRRVGGDAQLAEDVVQTVFTDLARKARTLRGQAMLGGWLHRHTCFVSSTLVRGESRRRHRERQAMEMNALLQSGESPWEDIAPVLDEAVNQLDDADRQAVLLRFFERRDLRSVGAALGTNEDAAQKRVSRAIEKLRTLLAQRGVTLSVAALATVLGTQALMAAPAGLAVKASSAALASAAAALGFAALLAKWLTPAKISIALGMASLAVFVAPWALRQFAPNRSGSPNSALTPGAGRPAASVPAQAAGSSRSASSRDASAPGVNSAAGKLRLAIVAADSGKPVPNVKLDYWLWLNGRVEHKEPLQCTRLGVCEFNVPRDTTELMLVSQSDGFADTRLDWRPDRGEEIPAEYTLRLARALPIGGNVVDADGHRVAGAHVSFGNRPDIADELRPETRNFGWPYFIETVTGADGTWRVDRMAPEALKTLTGGASHAEHVRCDVDLARNPEATNELLALKYTFKLGRAATVRGVVVDPEGLPVSNADVLVGIRGEVNSRTAKSSPDGAFTVAGCKPGKNLLTADAAGFTATTIEVQLSEDSGPFQVQLQRGKILRIRVVDKNGGPVPNAGVWLDTINSTPGFDSPEPKPVQSEFNRKTGADGRLVWESAPEANLVFAISAPGHLRMDGVKLRPDGEEHVITLTPALTISGTVRDGASGELIPRFRIVTGWPSVQHINGAITNIAQWSTLDRFWLNFSGGQYRHSFEEPVVGGVADPSFIFKFEADGYAPWVSRTIRADEGDVRLDVKLTKAAIAMVTVLSPGGVPLAGANVGLVSPGAWLSLNAGGLSQQPYQSSGTLLTTDERGQFRLPPDDAITRVVAANAAGFAEAAPSSLTTSPVLQMQPWGRLEGIYLAGGKPAPGRTVLLQYGSDDLSTLSSSLTAETDAQGRFTIAQAPPGRHKLARVVVTKMSPTMTSSEKIQLTEVDVSPGQTTAVTLGASNYAVTARLRWPEGMKRETHWRVLGSIHTPFPNPPAEAINNPEALGKWRQLPEIQALAAQARHYRITEEADGSWCANEVLPGEYALTVNVLDQSPAGGPASIKAHASGTVTVPADPPSGTLDLGEIALQTGNE